MRIESNLNISYSDTCIPDYFITEYLSVLSENAIKIYLYSMMIVSKSGVYNMPSKESFDFKSILNISEEELKETLVELASHGIINLTDKGFIIQDIKENEIRKKFRPKTSSSPQSKEKINSDKQMREREKVIKDIGKTFFGGMMSSSWYYEIDNWFDLYGFEPQVLYALFTECNRRGKLNSKTYIKTVAGNWGSEGIKTYNDLVKYYQSHDKVKNIAQKVGKKLRKNITQYDEDLIRRWTDKFGYDFDIIDIALKKTSRLANPNLEYTNKIIEEWFSHKLNTAGQVKEFEDAKREKYRRGTFKRTKGRESAGCTPSNIGNFNQRGYDRDFLDNIADDFGNEENQP